MAWVTKSSEEQYTPEPAPREYTKQEKARNWWHYHWVMVLVAVIVAVILGWLIHDMFFRVQPDVEIGYVGPQRLPEATVQSLQEALAPYCSDLNGDGQVVVQISEFTLDFATSESADPYSQLAGTTQLSAALTPGSDTHLFLIADPANFQAQTQSLQYTDGTLPDDAHINDWQKMVYRWSDCPLLAGLDLGDYSNYIASAETAGSSQDLLSGLYIGLRGDWEGKASASYTASADLWTALTAGAVPLEE